MNLDKLIWNHKGFPKKTTEEEDVILVVREDIIVLILNFVGLYGLFLLVFLARTMFLSLSSFWINLFDAFTYFLATLFSIIFLLIFHNYYLSLQIITSERIIDIDQVSLFRREVNSTSIGKVEDVTFKKINLLNLVFDYGDVIVQTAGQGGPEQGVDKVGGFVFNQVPSPQEIANIIDQLQQKNENLIAEREARANATALQEILTGKSLN